MKLNLSNLAPVLINWVWETTKLEATVDDIKGVKASFSVCDDPANETAPDRIQVLVKDLWVELPARYTTEDLIEYAAALQETMAMM